ncbi:MAG: FtsX-like permease family protein [Chloroflexi bacterium]|nr:FtsX-like permease family protein [Chloroflexota bacterium]
MNLVRLTWSNIAGSRFRSWVVFFCAIILAGFAISATLVIGGARKSLQLALERLGADIIVVPTGSEERVQDALLMGRPVRVWMPRSNLDVIGSIPGVSAVSPQLYLATLRGATCCSVPEMFLIAYEPETDFTLRPWLEEHLDGGLSLGQAVGGAFVYLPADQENILIYGYPVDLVGTLDATGTGLDQSMFFTFETAREIARLSPMQAVQVLVIPQDSVSSALVRIESTADSEQVAAEIAASVPNVTPMESASLFKSQRAQILMLSRSIVVLLGIVWLMAIALIAVVFSIAANERRRQIGVMRALGATRRDVLVSLMAEGAALASAGGFTGGAVAAFGVFLFRNLITELMGGPFFFPSIPGVLLRVIEVLGITLVTVLAAAFVPALRISLTDPAIAMRE